MTPRPGDRPLTPIFRHSLVLCAALVENPMNLGALCRTAEVLGVATLVLPRLALTGDRGFRKLAVSAHHWQPLEECPPNRLADWLAAQRQSGQSVLALMPHPGACPLPQFRFPQRSTLILGRELTGIPPDIVARCDGAIAIPQYGQVESLNVATAAAIAAYEYIRQWPLPERIPPSS